MFIETRILGESSTAVFYGANIRFFAGMNAYVIFVVRRTGERFAAHRLCTFIRSLSGVRPNVYLK